MMGIIFALVSLLFSKLLHFFFGVVFDPVQFKKWVMAGNNPLLPSTVRRKVEWIKVAERWTRVSVMTNVVEDKKDEEQIEPKQRTNFLMIPGNSGNEGYYEQFGRELIPLLDAKHGDVYFYTVSHLNHVPMPKELVRTGKSKPSDLFSLDEQIQHKKDYCTEYLPKEGKLFAFGHSIGCYIALKLLPFLVENGWQVSTVYPLYPAIERLCDTPNGKRLRPFAKFFTNHNRTTKCLFFWLKLTPFWLKRLICSCSLKPYGKSPECVVRAGAECSTINCVRNVCYITTCEMEQITEFDPSLIAHKEHIRFYYGTDDSWILPEFVDDMRKRLPGQVMLDKHQMHHAFCIKDNEIMAKVIAELVGCETCEVDDTPFAAKSRRRFLSVADWLF